MATQISLRDVEKLVRQNILHKGLQNDISVEQLASIVHNITNKLSANKTTITQETQLAEQPVTQQPIQPEPEQTVQMPVQTTTTPAVTQQPVHDEESIKLAKKEGELEVKEQQITQKEEELSAKELELHQKEEQLAYKPQIPSFIEKAEPGKVFIFDMNELNLGAESLMQKPYHLVDEPDKMKSMESFWLEEAKIRAEMFIVEYKKIGSLVFNPLAGTCTFEQLTSPLPENIPQDDSEGVKQAIASQYPTEPMIDTIDPVVDVIEPLKDDMGLTPHNVEKSMQDYIQRILKDYFNMQTPIYEGVYKK